MKTPIQVIADMGCPTHSVVEAMRFFGEREDLTREQYEQRIQQIVGLADPPETDSHFFAKCLFKYVVHETIRMVLNYTDCPMQDILDLCYKKTYVFIQDNPWSETLFNVNHGLQESEEINPETGEVIIVKPSKGAKKDVTERIFADLKSKGASRHDIIDAFVQGTGMSKAGATTYFHALKKELGFSVGSDKKTTKGESKQEIANRLYQSADDKSKPTMIALFAEQLGTSKLGAQTYYYACKKKFEPLTAAQ